MKNTAKLTALGSVIGCPDLVVCQECKEPVERLYQCDECGDASPLRCWRCADTHEAEPHWTDSMTTAERGW